MAQKEASGWAIYGYYDGRNIGWFSYRAKDGWCRQIYDTQSESQWEFIGTGRSNEYYIRNAYNDERKGHWLSYGQADNDGKDWVGLYSSRDHRACWQFIKQGKANKYKVRCHYNGSFRGWLTFQWDGKWCYLTQKRAQAGVYSWHQN